jgi:hypothetical protein
MIGQAEPAQQPEGERAVYLAVWADTRYLSPPQVERFVRAMEQITVHAALDPLAAAGVEQSTDFAS